MTYAAMLRSTFPDLEPRVDDLLLLEAHQIAQLPKRAPAPELAEVLHAYPRIRTFLIARYPPIEDHLDRLLAAHGDPEGDLAESEQALLWEIADLIVYQKAPEAYDALAIHDWVFDAVTDVTPLDGKTVIDAGAGTGRVSFEAVRQARHVFAVEPVARLREFMRDKAVKLGIDNLFVLDGTLDAVPLPAGSADVLITCRAIGWNLEDELAEIERVVKPGGVAMHLGMPHPPPQDDILHERLTDAGYVVGTHREGQAMKYKYWKHL